MKENQPSIAKPARVPEKPQGSSVSPKAPQDSPVVRGTMDKPDARFAVEPVEG